jgi:hypothetical protein
MKTLVDRVRASKLSHLLVGLITAIAAIGVTVIVTPDHTVTVRVGQKPTVAVPNATTVAGADAKRDNVITLDPAAKALVRQANAAPDTLDLAGNLRGHDTGPAGVLQPPLAAPSWPGCRTAFVRNFSDRHGNTPRLIWLHYTGGGNRPGWSDIDGLTAYANNPASQVSWHFNIDREGNCAYTVPIQYKAWTEAGANSTGVGIEFVGTGGEPDYAGALDSPGFRKLAAVVIRISKLEHIPLRLGAVSNCSPTRSGIVTHWMGGPCSGGHIDIKPYSLPAVIAKIRALAAPAVKPVSAHTQAVCRKYAWFGAPGSKLAGSRSAHQRVLHGQRRRYLLRNRIACSRAGAATRR